LSFPPSLEAQPADSSCLYFDMKVRTTYICGADLYSIIINRKLYVRSKILIERLGQVIAESRIIEQHRLITVRNGMQKGIRRDGL
jgi:hypothetical protein